MDGDVSSFAPRHGESSAIAASNEDTKSFDFFIKTLFEAVRRRVLEEHIGRLEDAFRGAQAGATPHKRGGSILSKPLVIMDRTGIAETSAWHGINSWSPIVSPLIDNDMDKPRHINSKERPSILGTPQRIPLPDDGARTLESLAAGKMKVPGGASGHNSTHSSMATWSPPLPAVPDSAEELEEPRPPSLDPPKLEEVPERDIWGDEESVRGSFRSEGDADGRCSSFSEPQTSEGEGREEKAPPETCFSGFSGLAAKVPRRASQHSEKSKKHIGFKNVDSISSDGLHEEIHESFRPLPVWCRHMSAVRPSLAKTHTKPMASASHFSLHPPEETLVPPPFMLHPSTARHAAWGFFGVGLIVYEAFSLPVELAGLDNLGASGFLMNWICRLYWTAVIPATFRTGFMVEDGTVRMDPKEVARHYASFWLPFDIGLVLCDWVQFSAVGSGRVLRIMRILRMVRLARLVKTPELMILTERVRSERIYILADFARIVCYMGWLAHITACAWYVLGDQENGWTQLRMSEEESRARRYAWSLHWALLQLSGSQLFYAETFAEQAFAMVAFFFFFVAASAFVSSITTSMTRLQLLASQDVSMRVALHRYLVDAGVTRPLAMRVERNANHMMKEQHRNAPESSVEALRLVSKPLREELHHEIHFRILALHPLFLEYNLVNHAGLRQMCHTAITTLVVSEGDILFRHREVPTAPKMLFVVTGLLRWRAQEEVHLIEDVGPGRWICEAVLWTTWVHRGTLSAVQFSRLLTLDARRFGTIVGSFPSQHAQVYATEFIRQLNREHSMGSVLSDVGKDDMQLLERLTEAFPIESDEEEGSEAETRTSERSARSIYSKKNSTGAVRTASFCSERGATKVRSKKPTLTRRTKANFKNSESLAERINRTIVTSLMWFQKFSRRTSAFGVVPQ